ncbi:hypothetical protein FOMA001_g12898 [Fusarium oxysporum f. sp. matthiolae]|nr:hypothetical protein FOMA001_g12898 [Fusarium oxysporum f. sp. matthiolae]
MSAQLHWARVPGQKCPTPPGQECLGKSARLDLGNMSPVMSLMWPPSSTGTVAGTVTGAITGAITGNVTGIVADAITDAFTDAVAHSVTHAVSY